MAGTALFFNLKASLSVGEAQHVIKCVKVEQRAKKGGMTKQENQKSYKPAWFVGYIVLLCTLLTESIFFVLEKEKT